MVVLALIPPLECLYVPKAGLRGAVRPGAEAVIKGALAVAEGEGAKRAGAAGG